MLLCAPLLMAAAVVSLGVSLVQTLTSVQEQTLTAVPRLVAVFVVAMVTMPWIDSSGGVYGSVVWDFHRYWDDAELGRGGHTPGAEAPFRTCSGETQG